MMDPGEYANRVETRVVAEEIPAAHGPVENGAISRAHLVVHNSLMRTGGDARLDLIVFAGEPALKRQIPPEEPSCARETRGNEILVPDDSFHRDVEVGR